MCIFPSPGRRGWFFSLKCVWQHHSQFLLKLYPKGQPRTKHTETRLARLLHIELQVLTAAINNSWNGWQWNLLELWGHDGNRRLIHPRLCNNNRAVTMTSTGRSRQKALAKGTLQNYSAFVRLEYQTEYILHSLFPALSNPSALQSASPGEESKVWNCCATQLRNRHRSDWLQITAQSTTAIHAFSKLCTN